MRADLYKDLYDQEETHWWHIAKRKAIVQVAEKFLGTAHKQDLKILDIGCGTGKNLETLSRFGEVYGVDESKSAVDYARSRGFNNVLQSSAGSLPFADETFDLITLLDVLEHIDEIFMNEVYRVLKKGGLLIVHVPAYQWLWSTWDDVLHHKRRYSKHSLTRVIKQHRLTVLSASHHFSYLLFPMILVRKIKSKLNKASDYSSDFSLNHSYIGFFLSFLSNIERALMRIGVGLPFGTSILGVAIKE